MGKVLIGNIKGPQGPTGVRGGMWLQGTAVTGTSTEETSFPDSNITYAIIGDAYFNVETCNVYACTKAGNPTDAKWVYTGNIKGVKGDTGSTQSIQNAVLEFNEALTRENIESTDTVETIFGKVKKYFTDLGSAAFMNVVNNVTQSEAGQAVLDAAVGKYLEEKKFDISKIIANRNITEPGFVMDGKTVADALTELNGKLGSTDRAYLSTSILEKALEITGQGFYMYVLSGDSYKGGDLPDYFYQFGNAIILKRNQGTIHVAILGVDVPLIINFYNGTRWLGWDTYVRVVDLPQWKKFSDVFGTSWISGMLNSLLKSEEYTTFQYDSSSAHEGVAIIYYRTSGRYCQGLFIPGAEYAEKGRSFIIYGVPNNIETWKCKEII